MAATHDTRLWPTSPRPRGRENTKNTLCRNVVIYGYCRHEKDGCAYSHETGRPHHSLGPAEKKRLNVESPSFTPSVLDHSALKSGFTPKAVSAAPFTPRSGNSGVSTPALVRHRSTEWSNHDIPEFVPQGFGAGTISDQSQDSGLGLGDPFNPYADNGSYNDVEATPPVQHLNPYAGDASAGAGAAYYQPPAGFTQPLQHHLYAPLGPHRENLLGYQRNVHDFFISENLRQDMQKKADATLQVLPNSSLPANLEHFHSLVPLDTNNQKTTSVFGYNTWLYKAQSGKDGMYYVLRRLEGFRLTNERAVRSVQSWKRVSNGNVVAIHDCFTTRAFGDSSLVFIQDYHPLSKTIAAQHFTSSSSTFQRNRNASGNIPEAQLWSYICQLASALKAIHSVGLAARTILPSKVLMTDKNRIRLSGCAVFDVVEANESQETPIQQQQQSDMQQLGHLILSLAMQNPIVPSNVAKALDTVARSYTPRLRDVLATLVNPSPPDIDTFLPTIADQLVASFDNMLHLEDYLYTELARELENSRIARLLIKLGFINERPEQSPVHSTSDFHPLSQPQHQHHQHPTPSHHHSTAHHTSNTPSTNPSTSSTAWSETGERYPLKLLRDYIFHQVDAQGRPVVDLGHVLSCLNKLDAGSEEKVALVSRDEQNVLVLSWREGKRMVESAFLELSKGQSGRRG